LTTAWTAENCSNKSQGFQQGVGGEVELSQALNGDLTGCFRVPSLHSSKLVIALQSFALRRVTATTPVTTIGANSTSDGDFTMSVSPTNVKPGETLTLAVHYKGARSSQIGGAPDLCWDGCQGGLQEQGNALHWVSRSTFHIAFQVPDAAWFEEKNNTVSIHPLTSGTYSIGIECIVSSSGCALRPADEQIDVHLAAPQSTHCVADSTCAHLTLSSNAAQVGDVVVVRGWAPLETIIGDPFGLNLTVTMPAKNQSFAPLSVTALSKGGFNLIVAPKSFAVRPDETWSDLGRVRTLSSSWSGQSTFSAQTNSRRIAWCQPSNIQITGGVSVQNISTRGVPVALKATNLKQVGPVLANPPCSAVMLDQHRATTVYAVFDEAVGGVAPPINLAGLYTSNAGATWHTVPDPPGFNVDDFAGFTTDTQGVVAMFAVPFANDDGLDSGAMIHAEVTSDGGLTWSPSDLRCPSAGPCVSFGPDNWGNCAMNGSPQPFLLGSHTTQSTSVVRWTTTTWVTTVDTCFSQQLVATSANGLLLFDPSSQYPLLRSNDGGKVWTNIDLPRIGGFSLESGGQSDANSLFVAPTGMLFASLANTGDTAVTGDAAQDLYELAPGATSWCQIRGVFGSAASGWTPSPLRLSGSNVAWSESHYDSTTQVQQTTLHVRSLTTLHC
jgi:hypothetical protein